MNPIELGKAIAEYGIPIITAVMLILVVGLVWYFVKRQTKREDKRDKQQEQDRKFHKDLITNHLTGLQETGEKNTALQENLIKHMEEHDNYCQEASKKIIESFSAICDKLNGKNFKKKEEKK